MIKSLAVYSLCVLLVLSVSLVDSKRSGGRKPSGGTTNTRRHQETRPRNTTGGHGGSNQHFLDSERHDTNNRGHIGFEKYNNPSAANPGSYKPSAPPAGGVNPGIGSAFGGANYPAKTQNTHVQSAPYPTHNNPGGFGSNPAPGNYQPGGFGAQPNYGNTHGSQYPAGNPFGGQPGGNLGHNQPSSGFGQPNYGGSHGSQYPGVQPGGGFGHNQPSPGFGHNQPSPGFGQPNHGSQYPGGAQPHYQGGYQQPNYQGYSNQGGHGYPGGSYGGNPGGFGGNPGGYNPGGGYGHGGYGGHPQSGGMYPGGGYKSNSGPGFGTGILGGAAGALPLGLLLGYGLGSMTSSHSNSYASPPAALPGGNNDAYNTWLKQRTEEKKQEIAATTGGDAKSVNQTEIIKQILNETQMCPGGAGVLDSSILNTMVPCNVTQVDFKVVNVTEPVQDDCKSLSLSIVQINTATNENKTITLQIKQNNITGTNQFVVLSYDIEMVACTTPIYNPDGKLCATRSFTADPYHPLNESMSYIHTANISITQFNTTLHDNCTSSGACGADSKPPRNLTSSFINLSILPEYPLNIVLNQCMIFKTNSCDPASTTPCDAPLVTSLQTIQTNTTLSKADFAYINFVLHESPDVFRAFTPAPPPENSGLATETKSSASPI